MLSLQSPNSKVYIVEHLDPELGPWSALEYLTIAKESKDHGATFCLSSVANDLKIPPELQNLEGIVIESRSVETLYENEKDRICLLDPAAPEELSPQDGSRFDIFLFGGILGKSLFPFWGWELCGQLMVGVQETILPVVRLGSISSFWEQFRLIPTRSDIWATEERVPWSKTGLDADDYRHCSASDANCCPAERRLVLLGQMNIQCWLDCRASPSGQYKFCRQSRNTNWWAWKYGDALSLHGRRERIADHARCEFFVYIIHVAELIFKTGSMWNVNSWLGNGWTHQKGFGKGIWRFVLDDPVETIHSRLYDTLLWDRSKWLRLYTY